MYRCYMIRAGRIAMRVDPDVDDIEVAVLRCRLLLTMQAGDEGFGGFEVWRGVSLVYQEMLATDAGPRWPDQSYG
ncbi:MAG: hypothetical protein QOH05_94 [Acetobacteraceae bacterium]|jgi:hypothetical protein|nr:hypothetical protein [Acetobacteraceae bacterium]